MTLINGAAGWLIAIIAIILAIIQSKDCPGSKLDLRKKDWWENMVVYQIYPRSFKDSDGDGVGDLKGITQNLEHFVDAGVDAVWLSPIFQSPMVDFGYDISDFYTIHSEYGTIEDFDKLANRAHKLGLKVLLDIVPNHASTESEYFKKSLKKQKGYEDFFIWRNGIPNKHNSSRIDPPNNWISQFSGSVWEWREERQQFYLHQFAVSQADFNFRNPLVREEMLAIMRYWLNRGADGFRIDALPYLMEREDLAHDPLSGLEGFKEGDLGWTVPIHTKDLLELYDVVYDWREFLDKYSADAGGHTRIMLTEGYANMSMTMLYYGNGKRIGAHSPFNFDFITELSGDVNARDIARVALRWLAAVPAGQVPNWVFGNHDNPRLASRYGSHLVDGLNMLCLTLPGIAVTYQGDELGMRDGGVSWEETVDVQALNMGTPATYLKFSRDPARTPYHWNGDGGAGFTSAAASWLPLAKDYKTLNLKTQKASKNSHYQVYREMTATRRHDTMKHGQFVLRALSENILALVRSLPGHESFTLLFNSGTTEQTADLSEFTVLPSTLSIQVRSTTSPKEKEDIVMKKGIQLVGGEALLLKGAAV